MMRAFGFLLIGLGVCLPPLVISLTTPACRPPTVAEAKAACTMLEAVSEDKTLEKICAVAPEAIVIAEIIASSRAPSSDAGLPMKLAPKTPCVELSPGGLCATNAELLHGIRVVVAMRAAR